MIQRSKIIWSSCTETELISPAVQHELLESAACLLLFKIKAEFFEPGRYYVLMADGYKDELKRELVAFSVRHVHTGKIKERQSSSWKQIFQRRYYRCITGTTAT